MAAARKLEIDGQADRALALLEAAVAAYPTTNLRKSLAALWLNRQNHGRAVDQLTRVLEREPSDLPTILLLAETLIEAGRPRDAVDAIQQAAMLGASRVRLFKLEQKLPEELQELTRGEPTADLDAPVDRAASDDMTIPISVPSADAPPGRPDPTSESAVFEDGTFSELSSLLVEAEDTSPDASAPGIFDTLVDTGFDDNPADRSFDNLLLDLGVPVETSDLHAKDDTTAVPRLRESEVAEQWGIDADGLAPPERTPRLHEAGRLPEHGAFADDDFDEGQKTELFDTGDRGDAAAPDLPDEDFPEEPPTRLENPSRKRARRATQQGLGPIRGPGKQKPSQDRARPPLPSAQPSSPKSTGERPLPPPARGTREERRRTTASGPAGDAEPASGRSATAVGQDPSSRPLGLIAAAAGAALLMALIGGAWAASSSAESAIEAHFQAFDAAATPDTYQGYLAGQEELRAALDASSFLGAPVDEALGAIGVMGDAKRLRAEAAAELAMLSGMLEYRYGHRGSHGAPEAIARASKLAGGDPRIEVGRGYELLTTGGADAAVELLEQTHEQHPGLNDARLALVRAQLDAGRTRAAASTASPLGELEHRSTHQLYVLALAERGGDPASADERLRRIIEERSADHLSARIVRSYTVRQREDGGGDLVRARALLESVLGQPQRASKLQIARAHIGMGAIYAAQESRARVEEQYRKAIAAIPERSSVYAPLIELYMADGRLDKARELVEEAAAHATSSPDIATRRAEILWLSGRPARALEVLDAAGVDSANADWLRGLAMLDLGRLEEAGQAFSAAEDANNEFTAASAYRLLTEELRRDESRGELSADLQTLLSTFSDDVDVLRAGALAALHVARTADDRRARQTLTEQAGKWLERASKAAPSNAVILYDLCRLALLEGRASAAEAHCRRARSQNAYYLPGLLTSVRLTLRLGQTDSALELLDDIAQRFPEHPTVSQLRAQAYLQGYQFDDAEAEINRWAGTPTAKTPGHLLVEGWHAFRRNRFTSALGYMQRAYERAPDDPRAAIFYAHTLTRLGEHERAADLVQKRLDDPLWGPIAWSVFGEIRRRQGRFDDARENFELALRKLDDAIAPPWRTAQAYTQLALTWVDRYGWDHRLVARYLYRGATRGDAEFPALNAARGTYHLRKRRPDLREAADAFEKAIDREPFNCAVLRALDGIYDELDAESSASRVERLVREHCED